MLNALNAAFRLGVNGKVPAMLVDRRSELIQASKYNAANRFAGAQRPDFDITSIAMSRVPSHLWSLAPERPKHADFHRRPKGNFRDHGTIGHRIDRNPARNRRLRQLGDYHVR